MAKQKIFVIAVIAVLIAAAGALYYFYLKPAPPEEIPVSAVEEPETAEGIQEDDVVPPIQVDLNESDDLVRKLVKELSSNPGLARWLVSDHLIRRFVSAVDLIAGGESPRNPADFIALKGNFQVSGEDGKVFINPKSYSRYDALADIFLSLDTEGFVTLYKQLRLPIHQAYRELGYPSEDFNNTFKKAINELLKTPVIEDRIYLDRDVLTYTMTDSDLENLTPAQKHLLRMGPENVRKIQAKLREIGESLGYINPELPQISN
jgi:hypothetical protein